MSTFTTTYIKSLKPRSKPYRVFESGADKGFGIQVSQGAKVFMVRYRVDGKTRYYRIGGFPECPLQEARERCRVARSRLDVGLDPQVERERAERARKEQEDADRRRGSMQALLDTYMDGQRDVYQRQIRNAFTLDVFAVVSSDSKAADFTPNDARLILHRVASRGSHLQANRVRSYLMAAFARAIEHDMNPLHMKSSTLFGVQMNPIRDIPRIVKREPVGDRALSADEVRDLWRLLLSGRHFDASTALVLRLAICTGQRINEVADIERADYDLDRALWSLPATKTKNRKPHLVPMHPLAVEALALAETLTPTGSQLFPNRDHPDQPIRLDSISKAVARFCKSDGWTHDPFTPRDLRRTWKTLTGELGLSKEIRDRIQNHALNDVASKHYDLWSYLPEKVTAMTAWGERLHRIVEGTSGALSQNVIAIRR